MNPSDALRSHIMRCVGSKNTAPELIVRRMLHGLGYRFRLHREDLPGKPDIVFPVRRKVIFINGCFWHGHNCRRGARVPKNNRDYWVAKIGRNKERDVEQLAALDACGWNTLAVWECECADAQELARALCGFLESRPA